MQIKLQHNLLNVSSIFTVLINQFVTPQLKAATTTAGKNDYLKEKSTQN